ncbi:bifunctional 4-hydroxy-2-oxoglutarate aldolase/2-dehydro-3-deoxy-phosphogluconate aldolase [Pirellulaceae bacterium SH449]
MNQSTSQPILDLALHHRLVAILRLSDLTHAVPLVEALLAGGVRLIEFTLTNPDAARAVAQCRSELESFSSGSAAIGLGSIRTVDEANLAIDSGSQFVVTPIFSPSVISLCKSQRTMICSGAFSPTEIYDAYSEGSDIVKVFPARALGPAYIKDVLAPMPFLRLMPTGGIDLNNVDAYFAAGAVAVGVGGQFLDPKAIEKKDWALIAANARAFVAACTVKGECDR